jgi:hypothetical protein
MVSDMYNVDSDSNYTRLFDVIFMCEYDMCCATKCQESRHRMALDSVFHSHICFRAGLCVGISKYQGDLIGLTGLVQS